MEQYIMPMDFSYYYDFANELKIKEWKKSFLPNSTNMLWEGKIVLPGEKEISYPYVALWPENLTIHEINESVKL